MLQNHVLDSASVLADKLSKNNLQLEAIRETPLAQAIDSSYHPEIANEVHEATLSFREVLMESSAKVNDGAMTHDEAISSIVDVVAKTVTNNLQIARTVVNPIVSEIVTSVESRLNETEIGAVNFLSVLPVFYHSIWTSPILEGLVSKYFDSPNIDVDAKRIYPDMTPEELRKVVKTGTSRFDTEVESFVDSLGDERLLEIYSTFFKKVSAPGDVQEVIKLQYYSKDVNAILVLHLIARRFYNDTPEGVEINLESHREFCSIMLEQTGRMMARFLERREKQFAKKDLGIIYPTTTYSNDNPSWNIIEVNGDIYNDWLKDGGSPEILFGAAISDNERNYTDLLENGEKYINVWAKQARIRQNEIKDQQFSLTISAIRQSISKLINRQAEEEMVVESKAVLHDRLQKELGELSPKSINDLYYACRRVVCRVMFAHTEAEEILCKIDEMGKRYPDIDVREAALYATIDLVTDWVAQMITCDQALIK